MTSNGWLQQMAPRANEVWRGEWKPGWVEPGRYLYDHELVVVSKGSCRVQVKAEVFDLEVGTFLIIPPGTYHATYTGKNGVHRSCFHFDWSRPPGRIRRLPVWLYHPAKIRAADIKRAPAFVPPGIKMRRFDPGGPVPLLMETLYHRWKLGSERERATSHLVLAELLLHLLWRGTPGRSSRDRSTRLAYAAKELLDRSGVKPVAIQPLLASLGFSYAHVCRIFKATFGLSPVKYQNAARLERAKELLRDPKRTIAEAAYEAGFSDPAYFSRKYRQSHGTPPSRARN